MKRWGGRWPRRSAGKTGTPQPAAAAAESSGRDARLRVKCGRIAGKVVRWKGEEGWIRPDRAIEHPFKLKNRGEIVIYKNDVEKGQDLKPGTQVDFLVYSVTDGGGRLGADFCRLLPKDASSPSATGSGGLAKVRGSVGAASQLLASTAAKLKSVGKGKGKDGKGKGKGEKVSEGEALRHVFLQPAAKAKVVQPAKEVQKNHLKSAGGTGAKGAKSKLPPSKEPGVKGAKGIKGDTKGAKGSTKGGSKERSVVSMVPRLGTITKWFGNYGWIEPDKAVEHPSAEMREGKIFLHAKDVQSEDALNAGTRVTFSVYADHSGLGAMNCKTTKMTTGGKVIPPVKLGKRSEAKAPALPPFWEKHWDDTHKMHYYWNSKTKESQWTKPTK